MEGTFRRAAGLALAGLILVHPLLPATAWTQVNVRGRWTSKYDSGARWDHQAVHLILTRSYDMAYHSQILYYDSNHASGPGFLGGVWGWKRDTTDTADCSQYPASTLEDRALGNALPHNIFCTGRVTMPNGQVLIPGGTEGGETGIVQTALFHPSTRTWEEVGDMKERRWYPTATVLPSGKSLVSSGSTYIDMQILGGRVTPDSLAPDSLQRLALTVESKWEFPAKPDTLLSDWPDPRDGHSAVWNKSYAEWTIFGGRGQDGLLQDTWFVYRNADSDTANHFGAVNVTNTGPGPRFRAIPWSAR